MTFIDPVTDLVVAGSAFSLLSWALQRTIGQRAKVKELQKRMQDIQKQVQAAAKARDEHAMKKMEGKEKEMMTIMNQTMMLSFKPLIIILPVFLVFIAYLQGQYTNFLIHLPFGLHVYEILRLPPIIGESAYGVRGFFIVVSIFCNLWLEFMYGQIDQYKQKRAGGPKTIITEVPMTDPNAPTTPA